MQNKTLVHRFKRNLVRYILIGLGLTASGFFFYLFIKNRSKSEILSTHHKEIINEIKRKISENRFVLDRETILKINFLVQRVYEDICSRGVYDTTIKQRQCLLGKQLYEEKVMSSVPLFLELFKKIEEVVKEELGLDKILSYEKLKEAIVNVDNIQDRVENSRLYILPKNYSLHSKEKTLEAFNSYLKWSQDSKKHFEDKVENYKVMLRGLNPNEVAQKVDSLRSRISMINYVHINDSLRLNFNIENEYHLYYLLTHYNLTEESYEVSVSLRDLSDI